MHNSGERADLDPRLAFLPAEPVAVCNGYEEDDSYEEPENDAWWDDDMQDVFDPELDYDPYEDDYWALPEDEPLYSLGGERIA